MTRQTVLKVIAVLEMVGGVWGLVLTLGTIANRGFVARELAAAVVPLTLFLLAMCSGWLLWHDRPAGYRGSVAVQLAQLLKFTTPQFAFAMSFGGDVAIMLTERQFAAGITFRTAGISYHIGPVAVVEFARPPGAPQWVGISVVSCVALVALRKGRQPAADSDERSFVAPAPGSADAEPDWVAPFWLKAVVALFGLFVACCAGLVTFSR
jgi:hypothetical protein